MERETRMLLWTLFAVGVLTVGLLPIAFGTFNHLVAVGVKANANLAQALWGQTPSPYATENTWLTNATVPILPGATVTQVHVVSWNTSTWPPQLTIFGSGFGNPPATGDAALTIKDSTRGFTAASRSTSAVKPQLLSWQNNRIVVGGFSDYGTTGAGASTSSEVFAPGDQILVSITNPQTGSTGLLRTQYPARAPMPVVTMDPLSHLIVGQSETWRGQVTLAGTGLAGQFVTLQESGQTTANQETVMTDGRGRFSATFTAPIQAGAVTVTASADTSQASAQVEVIQPTVSMDPISPVGAGQSVDIRGRVGGIGGSALMGQVVTLATSGGQVSPQTIVTGQDGQFTAVFTAPVSGGTASVIATCDGQSATSLVAVRAFAVTLVAVGNATDNQITLTATVNQPLDGATLRIVNQTTGQIVAQTDQGSVLTTTLTMPPGVSQTFVAQIL